MRTLLKYSLQPLVIGIALAVWLQQPDSAVVYPATLLLVLVLLGLLEYLLPARRDWRIGPREKVVHILFWLVLTVLTAVVVETYAQLVAGPLMQVRQGLNADIWPHHWPALIQVFMVFFIGEFIWYWIHRAEHRWTWVWRTTGHGAHHAFGKLNALNYGLNHPFELLFLVAPAATLELLFGIGTPAAGAVLLLTIQAAFAHANLDLNSRVIGWLLTTNRHHIHHHSVDRAQSNTNYGCAAIIWDRLFGTFADAPTERVGSGHSEPSMWRKCLMPFTEPTDTVIAPANNPASSQPLT